MQTLETKVVDLEQMDEMTIEQKKEILNTLTPGMILQFRRHEMLYLGKQGDKYYVSSNVSSLSAADDTTDEIHMLRVRSVVVNDLTTRRPFSEENLVRKSRVGVFQDKIISSPHRFQKKCGELFLCGIGV